jgi:hypothetical protein
MKTTEKLRPIAVNRKARFYSCASRTIHALPATVDWAEAAPSDNDCEIR